MQLSAATTFCHAHDDMTMGFITRVNVHVTMQIDCLVQSAGKCMVYKNKQRYCMCTMPTKTMLLITNLLKFGIAYIVLKIKFLLW